MRKSNISKIVKEDTAAQIWLRVLGGNDVQLPDMQDKEQIVLNIGKRTREQFEEKKNPEEENKGGAGDSKRSKYNDAQPDKQTVY